MRTDLPAGLDKYLLGGALLLAILFGGNSAPGFWIDQAIQLVMICAASIVIWRNPERATDPRLLLLIGAILVAIALQLVPLPRGLIDPLQNVVQRIDPDLAPWPQFRPVTLGIGRTLEALGWMLACGLFAISVTRIDFGQAYGLVPIFLIGVLFHLVAGLMQYSAAGINYSQSVLGFRLSAGLFANSNHFSALAFISIPLAFAYFFDRRKLAYFFVYLAITLLTLLAAGSRAGVVIGLAVTMLSSLIVFRRGAIGTLALLCGTAIAGIFALGVWVRISDEGLGSSSRSTFASTSWQGFLDNLPFGVGYGGFVNVYPAYEQKAHIFRTYVNHAHNDFLELLFEGGIVAGVVIIAAICLFVLRTLETVRWPLHFACALSICFLLVHSVVDYPLRSLAISSSLSMMTAILFHQGTGRVSREVSSRRRVRRRTRADTRHSAGSDAFAPSSCSTIAHNSARTGWQERPHRAQSVAWRHRS